MEIKLKDYEKNLERLMKIVNQLEANELSLVENVKLYEEGNQIYAALKHVLEDETSKLQLVMDGELKPIDSSEIGGLNIDQ